MEKDFTSRYQIVRPTTDQRQRNEGGRRNSRCFSSAAGAIFLVVVVNGLVEDTGRSLRSLSIRIWVEKRIHDLGFLIFGR